MTEPVYNNKANVPLPLALWLAVDEYKYGKYPNEISTTTLLRSPRYIIGSRRMLFPNDFPEHLRNPAPTITQILELPDIQSRLKSRIGTAIHSSAEYAWNHMYDVGLELLGFPKAVIERVLINPEPSELKENSLPVYMEQRAYRELDGFVISGQYDFVIDGNLHDIKSTSTYVWQTGVNDEKYILQGSIYRWLNPEMITGDELTINFLFTDWQAFKAQSTEGYPSYAVMGKKYKLMSLEETEAYLRNKIKLLHKHWNDPLELIPCCTEKELYSSPPKYKYYKKGQANQPRATKVFDNYAAASAYMNQQGNVGEIVEFKGNPFYCDFCIPQEVPDTKIVKQESEIEFE